MAIEVDVIRRVFATNEQAFLEIGPWSEDPDGCIELRTTNPVSKEWFGSIAVAMSPEFAEALANTLIIAVNEMKAKA